MNDKSAARSASGVTLQVSLATAFVVVVACTALVLGAASFVNARRQMRTDLREQLLATANTVAAAIDAVEHARLREPIDMEGAVYAKYRRLFAAVRSSQPEIHFLYTMRQTAEGVVVFVLDSGTAADEFSPLGSVYDDAAPAMLATFAQPPQARVDEEFYADEWGVWLSGYAPIVAADGSIEGIVGVDMSAADIAAAERWLLLLFGAITLAGIAAGATAGVMFARQIAVPLVALSGDMGRIRDFRLDPGILPNTRILEVRHMVVALENMKTGLRSFQRYVPSDVVRSLIRINREAVPETERVTISVLFTDLENFTAVSERLGAELVPGVLGPYFRAMTSTLQAHGATVDKFIGDAIMAFWNAPLPEPDHALRACRAALACRRAVAGLRADWESRGIEPMRTRMGISTGEAMVGNIGYEERLAYTAIGDTVNLAARLESLNKFYGTTMLISESTWEGASAGLKDGLLHGRLVDRVAVKGRSLAGGIYELLSDADELPEGWPEFLGIYGAALELYFAGRFDAAARRLRDALAIRPADGPSRVLLERCIRFQAKPPVEWTGVTVMQDK